MTSEFLFAERDVLHSQSTDGYVISAMTNPILWLCLQKNLKLLVELCLASSSFQILPLVHFWKPGHVKI